MESKNTAIKEILDQIAQGNIPNSEFRAMLNEMIRVQIASEVNSAYSQYAKNAYSERPSDADKLIAVTKIMENFGNTLAQSYLDVTTYEEALKKAMDYAVLSKNNPDISIDSFVDGQSVLDAAEDRNIDAIRDNLNPSEPGQPDEEYGNEKKKEEENEHEY